jgi:hypothetical protein
MVQYLHFRILKFPLAIMRKSVQPAVKINIAECHYEYQWIMISAWPPLYKKRPAGKHRLATNVCWDTTVESPMLLDSPSQWSPQLLGSSFFLAQSHNNFCFKFEFLLDEFQLLLVQSPYSCWLNLSNLPVKIKLSVGSIPFFWWLNHAKSDIIPSPEYETSPQWSQWCFLIPYSYYYYYCFYGFYGFWMFLALILGTNKWLTSIFFMA